MLIDLAANGAHCCLLVWHLENTAFWRKSHLSLYKVTLQLSMQYQSLMEIWPDSLLPTRESDHKTTHNSYMYMAVITGMFSCEFIEHTCCHIKPSQTSLDTWSALDPHRHIISLDLLHSRKTGLYRFAAPIVLQNRNPCETTTTAHVALHLW